MAKELKLNLPSVDDLFSTQEERDDAQREKVMQIPLTEISGFPNHPFKVRMNYSLQDNRDMLTFFEKYRKVAGKALGVELDRLITDMQIGNHEAALRNMDARLGLPSFSTLCAVLCGVYQGVDQHTSLVVLEQDMRTKEREALRRLMEKRPGRIKIASFILTMLMIIMFMVPLILLIIGNLQAAGF